MDLLFSNDDDTPTEVTTDEHYTIFREEVSYWISLFGLTDWALWFAHDLYNGFAWFGFEDISDRIVTFGLSTEWPGHTPNHIALSKSAFHEVCELLLCMPEAIAGEHLCPSDRDRLREAAHATIRRLEHVVWLPDYERRFPSTQPSPLDGKE